MKTYQHTQFGSAIVLTNGAIGLAILLVAAFGPHPAYFPLVGAGILLVGALFSTLTIRNRRRPSACEFWLRPNPKKSEAS